MRNIVFWRGIEDASFKPTDGGYLYYPYGALRGGYVVTAEQKAALNAFIRKFYLAATILIVAQGLAVPFLGFYVLPAVVLVLAALLMWFHFGIREHVAGARRADQQLGFGEAQRMAIKTMSNGRVVFTLVCGVLLLAGSILFLRLGMDSGDRNAVLLGTGAVILFGLLFVMGCYTAWLKWGRQA